MIHMKNSDFKFIAAPFTPFYEDGTLNLEQVKIYSDYLNKSGIWGVFISGTSGEGISLTIEERKKLILAWIKYANGLKIFAQVGDNCLEVSKELSRFSQENGADYIASFAPSYYRPSTSKDLANYLAAIASSAPDLPFYYYHIPSFTNVNLAVSQILRECDNLIPNLKGIKFTHFDLYDMQNCIEYGNRKYDIIHGYDETLLCGLSIGVRSAIGSTYNYFVSNYQKIEESFRQGNIDKAKEFQYKSVELVNILNKHGGGVRCGKAIMNLIGIDCGNCRLPIAKFDKEELLFLRKELEQINFFT